MSVISYLQGAQDEVSCSARARLQVWGCTKDTGLPRKSSLSSNLWCWPTVLKWDRYSCSVTNLAVCSLPLKNPPTAEIRHSHQPHQACSSWIAPPSKEQHRITNNAHISFLPCHGLPVTDIPVHGAHVEMKGLLLCWPVELKERGFTTRGQCSLSALFLNCNKDTDTQAQVIWRAIIPRWREASWSSVYLLEMVKPSCETWRIFKAPCVDTESR